MSVKNAQIALTVSALLERISGAMTTNGVARHQVNINLGSGSAAGQVDTLYSARRTVDTGVPDVIDVNALTDASGATCANVHIMAIIITNKSTTAGQDITVGGGSNPVHASIAAFLEPGASYAIVAPSTGFPVTNATADEITVSVAAGTGVAYDITILGRTA